jgi:xanthine dehydrogenase accessory factor
MRSATDPATPIAPDTTAVVVASHGRDENAVLAAALRADVPYVGLIASRRRGAAVVAELAAELAAPGADRVHTPAGLDIGARTAPEVALAVLAEILAERPAVRRPGPDAPAHAEPAGREEIDPVCGMAVAVAQASPRLDHGGRTVYFCGPGCREAFAAAPDAYS